MIRKISNRLSRYYRNTALLVRHLFRGRTSSSETHDVHFDVTDPRLERYFYCLVRFFDIAGLGISLRFRPGLFLNLRNYADLLYNIEGLKITSARPRSAVVTITDRKELPGSGKTLYLDTDYLNKSKSESGFVFPYSMHPLAYDKRFDDSIVGLRSSDRPLRIFSYFAKLENYGKNDMRNLFGKMNRKEVGEAVLAMSTQLPMEMIRTPESLTRIESGESAIAVVDDVRIPLEGWLPTLARSDFFIAAPGVLMPFCHNLVEAMAVGTIPITEYPEMWSPPLTDSVNCLAFSGPVELEEKISEALEMDEDQVAEMRRAAIEYYDTWFDPKVAVERLMGLLDNLDRIYLLAGHLSVSKFKCSRIKSP